MWAVTWKLVPRVARSGTFFNETRKSDFYIRLPKFQNAIQPTSHEFATPALVRQLFPLSLPTFQLGSLAIHRT